MELNRRNVLLFSGCSAATIVGGGIYLLSGVTAEDIKAVIVDSFGQQLADQAATDEFTLHFSQLLTTLSGNFSKAAHSFYPGITYEARNSQDAKNIIIISAFVRSTNVILALERGDDLEFFGLHNAYSESTCLNTLSSHIL